MFINKVLELYWEACRHGLSVSLSINNLNGQESFSLATIPGPDLAGRPERHHRPRGGRRQRRHRQDQQECSAKAAQPAAVAPSYAAVVRSPPSPLQPSTAKRAKHSSAAVKRAVVTHTAAESADEAAEGTPCAATNTTFSTMDTCHTLLKFSGRHQPGCFCAMFRTPTHLFFHQKHHFYATI